MQNLWLIKNCIPEVLKSAKDLLVLNMLACIFYSSLDYLRVFGCTHIIEFLSVVIFRLSMYHGYIKDTFSLGGLAAQSFIFFEEPVDLGL